MPSASEAPLPAGRKLSHFELVKVLGQGAMGTVYLAKDLTLRRSVALKVMKPEAFGLAGSRERFLHEARSGARLSHPNIVPVHEFGEADGISFLAMEYVDGETLDRLLSRVGRFTPRDVLSLAMQAVAGLSHAARQGTIHRDVKPANLLLGSDGRLRVLDFGLARAIDAPSLTDNGLVLGTPDYMSPEQALGEKIDYATDVFSLGIVIHQLLSGKLPFGTGTTFEVLKRRTESPPAPIEAEVPGLPPQVLQILARCLARQPGRRYPSYDALGADLLEALKSVPDWTVLPLAAQLTTSQVTSIAHLAGKVLDDGVEEETAIAPIPAFPPLEGPRLLALPHFLLRPIASMAGIATRSGNLPVEPLRVWAELTAAGWVLGLLLGPWFWPQPGPLTSLLMLAVYGAAIRAANGAQSGTLGWAAAFEIAAWCTAPCIFWAEAPVLSALASLGYLVLAIRFAAASDLPGVGRQAAASPAGATPSLTPGQTPGGKAAAKPGPTPEGKATDSRDRPTVVMPREGGAPGGRSR